MLRDTGDRAGEDAQDGHEAGEEDDQPAASPPEEHLGLLDALASVEAANPRQRPEALAVVVAERIADVVADDGAGPGAERDLPGYERPVPGRHGGDHEHGLAGDRDPHRLDPNA